jgi:hypothetical protein
MKILRSLAMKSIRIASFYRSDDDIIVCSMEIVELRDSR